MKVLCFASLTKHVFKEARLPGVLFSLPSVLLSLKANLQCETFDISVDGRMS